MEDGRSVKKGDIVFYEGNFSDSAFIIESGRFEVSVDCEDGTSRVVGILQGNDIFGEMGLIDGRPRCATVKAVANSRVTILTREAFDSLTKRRPGVLVPLFRIVSSRLRNTLSLKAQATC